MASNKRFTGLVADRRPSELIVLAPGVKTFGGDQRIDELIRKYGYQSNVEVLKLVDENEDLQQTFGSSSLDARIV